MLDLSNTRFGNSRQALRDVVSFHSGLYLAHGVILTILGFAAFLVGQWISTLEAGKYIGWILLLRGLWGMSITLFAVNRIGIAWTLLTGALALLTSVSLLWYPFEEFISVRFALTAFLIVESFFQIVFASAYRLEFPSWSPWVLMSGVVDLVLAGVTLLTGPSGATLGLVVGISLITSGVAIMLVAAIVKWQRVASLGA
jgi:membrane protein HdeD